MPRHDKPSLFSLRPCVGFAFERFELTKVFRVYILARKRITILRLNRVRELLFDLSLITFGQVSEYLSAIKVEQGEAK